MADPSVNKESVDVGEEELEELRELDGIKCSQENIDSFYKQFPKETLEVFARVTSMARTYNLFPRITFNN
jgi:hypothetical protein